MSKIVCIAGPTATGKTELSLALADEINAELVSVDSVLIYKDLDIGSAKPSNKILVKYPHYMINILKPIDSYSVVSFIKDIEKIIKQAKARNKNLILVGGSMMYFNALINGFSFVPESKTKIRHKINKIKQEKGLEYLYKKLINHDNRLSIHVNDNQRITRAAEVYYQTGKSILEFQRKKNIILKDFVFFALCPKKGRKQLDENIKLRTQQMLTEGLIDETKQVIAKYDLQLTNLPKSLASVGYKQVCDFLSDNLMREQLEAEIIHQTSCLAKRQLTWLNKFDEQIILDCFAYKEVNLNKIMCYL